MRAASLLGLSIVFIALWSSGWIVSRFAIEEVSAIALLTMRYCIVFILLSVFVSLTGRWQSLTRNEVLCHLSVGMLSHAIYLLAGVGAFELGVSAGLVAFVTALQPMVTALLSAPITHEKTTMRQWQGLLIGFVAVLLLVSQSYQRGVPVWALIMPFLAVLALSTGTLLNRRTELHRQHARRQATPVTVILLIHSIGALCVLIPLSLATDKLQVEFNANQWMVLIWLAVVVSLGAYAVMLLLLRHLSAMCVSSLSYLVPPATMIQAFMMFGDTITAADLSALFIAAAGVYFVMVPKGEKPLLDRWQTLFGFKHRDTSDRGTLHITKPYRNLLMAVSMEREPDIEL